MPKPDPTRGIVARSLWRQRKAIDITVRVMGCVEHHVVFRRKGAAAQVLHGNDFWSLYEPHLPSAERTMDEKTTPETPSLYDIISKYLGRGVDRTDQCVAELRAAGFDAHRPSPTRRMEEDVSRWMIATFPRHAVEVNDQLTIDLCARLRAAGFGEAKASTRANTLGPAIGAFDALAPRVVVTEAMRRAALNAAHDRLDVSKAGWLNAAVDRALAAIADADAGGETDSMPFRQLSEDVLRCIPADWNPSHAREWGKLGPLLAEFIDDLREGRSPRTLDADAGGVCAQAFHISEYIEEEMAARGWDRDELALRMGGDFGVTRLALDLLMEVRTPDVIIGEQAEQLGRAFGTSAALWRNLHETWRKHPTTPRTPDADAGGDDA